MKKILMILSLSVVALVISGCGDSQPQTPKEKKCTSKVKPGMTSAQVEAAIKWEYCESKEY